MEQRAALRLPCRTRMNVPALVLLMAFGTPVLAGDTAPCTAREVKRADSALGRFNETLRQRGKGADWNSLHSLFLEFRRCDDASIAESFDDIVDSLLCQRWEKVGQLLAIEDHDFFDFVVRHAALPKGEKRLLPKRSDPFCPTGHGEDCHALMRACWGTPTHISN